MKKHFLKPGFELIFALSLIVILGLPPMLMAQNQKDVEISIQNGDTTVNGKNIKSLTTNERKEALQDLKHINGPMIISDNPADGAHGQRQFFYQRKDTTGGRLDRAGRRMGNHPPMITENIIIKDSLGNVTEVSPRRSRGNGPKFDDRQRGPGDMGFRSKGFERPFAGGMGFGRKNSQNFDYDNVDKDGIATHISFHVSEASNDDLKRMPHVEGGKFEISDLNIVPQFTSGKVLLMFNLSSKATAEVNLTDSEGKILWTEKSAGGSFNKAFSMGLNGIYYLQIKQGNNVSVKRIMKQE